MGIDFKNDNTDFLVDCILKLENKEECYAFFQDLFTVNEFHSMAQRCVVAKMLSQKKVYNDIVKETGASTATISRVNRSLQYGADGYEKIFERVE
jgi:TrpR-related protein YerC/YecD